MNIKQLVALFFGCLSQLLHAQTVDPFYAGTIRQPVDAP